MLDNLVRMNTEEAQSMYIKFLKDNKEVIDYVRQKIVMDLGINESDYEQELDFLAEDLVLDLLNKNEPHIGSFDRHIEVQEDNSDKYNELTPLQQEFVNEYLGGDAGAIGVLRDHFNTQELVDLYKASWEHDNFEEDGEPYDDFVDRFRKIAIKYIDIDILSIEDTYGRG